MSMNKSFLYKEVIKNSRKTYRSIGVPQFMFLVLFGLARDYVFLPLMGKLWGLALMTTPEGFISNTNVLPALIKSPWIIPIGAALLVLYAILAVWQVTAIIIGIDYARKGQKIRLVPLIRISLRQMKDKLKTKNLMILLYSFIIVPLANFYQTNELVGSFIVPEYIQDFINSKLFLFLIFIALMLFVAYIFLRWFFLLPGFILKNRDFKLARDESNRLTEKSWLKNGINIILYSVVEFLRLSIAPLLLVMLPVFLCYYFTRGLDHAASLFSIVGVSFGLEAVQNITGSLAQISTMCFLVELYYSALEAKGMDTKSVLPEPGTTYGGRVSSVGLHAIFFGASALVLAGAYLSVVFIAQNDADELFDIFGNTSIIAHKGYSSKAPENTMPAFELADKCDKVGYIELDVWTSKDGIPVVIHNSTIKDATGADRYIYDCTYEELQALPAPYSMDKEQFADARIPGLEEVIKKYAGSTPLLIEIKGFKQDPQLSAKIVELMKKYGCEYTSLIHSGDYEAISAVKRIDPNIPCGLILAMVTGNYYDLPNADFFSIEHTFVDQNTVSLIHRRGKGVYAWTVNYDESADELRFTGVDGLITDVPEEISEYVSDTNDLLWNVVEKKIARVFSSGYTDTALREFSDGSY